MSKRENQILKELVNENGFDTDNLIIDEYKKALLKVQSVHVITGGHFSGIVDNNWYIGTREYMFLLRYHLFKYVKNLRSLRLHYVITQQRVLRKLHLPDDYIGFHHNTVETKIKSLPDEIGELEKLVTLDLSYTIIRSIPDSVSNLYNLEFVLLHNTLIEKLPVWIGNLKKIQILTLSNLSIHSLPKSIMELQLPFRNDYDYIYDDSWEKGIYINNTKLMTQPISLFSQNRELIESYYDSEKIELHESKVIFIGDGGAGKSYTIQRILNNGVKLKKDTSVTHDITIENWGNNQNDVEFTGSIDFWDFGGQDIYLSMHRCFLTERSCYVIVLSNRQYGSHRGLMRQARYWLKNIAPFVKYSPILIAVNNWSGQPKDGISLSELKVEFPEISYMDQVIYNAHSENILEFNRITDKICEMARKNYSYALQFPKSWDTIRKRLRYEYTKENFIAEKDYYSICKEEMKNSDGYFDCEIAQWLLHWFNDLGYCFNYHDIGEVVEEEYQVLKPQWVIKAMYKIINYKIDRCLTSDTPFAESLPENLSSSNWYPGGIVPEERIIDILIMDKSYSETAAQYIIRIMKKFRLAYSIPDQEFDVLFIPSLCSDIKPDGFDKADGCYTLKTEYLIKFKYLPEAAIHHLMMKCYQNDRIPRKVWKYGFHLKAQQGYIISEMMNDDSIVLKYYQQKENQDSYGLHEMRGWLTDIYAELGIEDAKDYIVKRSPRQNAYIDVKALLGAYNENPKMTRFFSQDDSVYQSYSVEELLSGLYGSNYQSVLKNCKRKSDNPGSISKHITSLSKVEIIIENIDDRFRTQFGSKPPENEKEVQEQLRKFFDAQGYKQGIDYERESGNFRFAGREYIPDFVFKSLKTVIEVKILKECSKKSKMIEEMNADSNAYTKIYDNVIFLVYDIGCISDVAELRRDFESKGNIKVLVVKH